ncbi:hypothetical protein I546_0017 [Mycobacterium kansasii 732]|nr:hypothetical protein I546_0017 [Mycobacterium kansasii 732]
MPTRAELLAALSVAIDLGLGQPAEHMLRSALIATRLADRLGLSRQQRDSTYYATLIMWIGCHADSHEYARWFGDDIAVRRDSYLVDWSGLPYLRFLAGNVGRGQPLVHRLSTMATLFINARGHISQLIHSHCTSAALLADRIGLDPTVQAAVALRSNATTGEVCPGASAATPSRSRCASPSSPTWWRFTTAPTVSRVPSPWLAAGGAGNSIPRWSTHLSTMRTRSWPARPPVMRGRRPCEPRQITTSRWTTSPWTRYSSRWATSST